MAKSLKHQILTEAQLRFAALATNGKTPTMVLIEVRMGRPIEELLRSGTCRAAAKKLGVNFATISRWRAKLGMGCQPRFGR